MIRSAVALHALAPGWTRVAANACVLFLASALAACSARDGGQVPAGNEADAEVTRMAAAYERSFQGRPPTPVEARESDYKVASGGYAEYMRFGFKPRPDVDPFVIELPFEWSVDPYRDNNWRFQLQAWRMLNPMWGEYRESRSPQVLEQILRTIRDWHRYHIVEGRTSSYEWQDMATGLRAQHLAYLYHLAGEGSWSPSVEDRKMLDELADLHARILHDGSFISINNHGIFQVHGLRLLCNAAPQLEPCRGEMDFSAKHMRKLIESQFDERGVHREDSSFYQLFAYKTFRGIRMALYPGIPRRTLHRIRLAENVAPWLTGLDGDLLQFGDSEGRGVPFRKAEDAGACRSRAEGGACVVAKDMSASGYVAIRSHPDVAKDQSFQLFVVGSSHDAGHDHADELSFLLSSRGVPIFVDGGKYGYQDDAHRRYFLSDRAHSVVGLRQRSFRPDDTVGEGSYISSFSQEGDSFRIEGRVARSSSFEHSRTFVYEPGAFLRLQDRVRKPADASLHARYVISPDVDVQELGNGAYRLTGPAGAELATVSFPGGERCRTALARGDGDPEDPAWISRRYLEVEPTTVLWATCPADVDRIETLIQLH
jgi:hypothetical protein